MIASYAHYPVMHPDTPAQVGRVYNETGHRGFNRPAFLHPTGVPDGLIKFVSSLFGLAEAQREHLMRRTWCARDTCYSSDTPIFGCSPAAEDLHCNQSSPMKGLPSTGFAPGAHVVQVGACSQSQAWPSSSVSGLLGIGVQYSHSSF